MRSIDIGIAKLLRMYYFYQRDVISGHDFDAFWWSSPYQQKDVHHNSCDPQDTQFSPFILPGKAPWLLSRQGN